MHKYLNRLLILLPLLAIIIALPAGAAYRDTDGHWGKGAIDEWSSEGIIQGADGFFRPNDPITRAEMATILMRLLKLEKTAPNLYTDLPEGAWYEKAVLACVQEGIMQGDGGGIIRPTHNVTRQEAIVMLGRAWKVTQSSSASLDRFTDGAKTADWAKGYVRSFVDLGYVNGVGNNELAPTGYINRASVVTILSNAIAVYANTDGESVTMSSDNEGIILVAAKDVKLSGSSGGMILISRGAQGSQVSVGGIAGEVNVAADNVSVRVETGLVLTVNFLGKGGKLIKNISTTVNTVTGEYTEESVIITPSDPDDPKPGDPGSSETPEIPLNPGNQGGNGGSGDDSGIIDGSWSPIF